MITVLTGGTGGAKFVDGQDACAGATAVRLVHQQDEVVEVGQVIEVTLPDERPGPAA